MKLEPNLVYNEVPGSAWHRDPQRRDFGNLAGSGWLEVSRRLEKGKYALESAIRTYALTAGLCVESGFDAAATHRLGAFRRATRVAKPPGWMAY